MVVARLVWSERTWWEVSHCSTRKNTTSFTCYKKPGTRASLITRGLYPWRRGRWLPSWRTTAEVASGWPRWLRGPGLVPSCPRTQPIQGWKPRAGLPTLGSWTAKPPWPISWPRCRRWVPKARYSTHQALEDPWVLEITILGTIVWWTPMESLILPVLTCRSTLGWRKRRPAGKVVNKVTPLPTKITLNRRI